MASTRTFDFACVFQGFTEPSAIKEITDDSFFAVGKDAYDAAAKQRSEARTLTRIDGSAGTDMPIAEVMKIINDKTGNDLRKIGSFVAIGSSNSCSLVLALAAELKTKGAPQLNYVGVVNVTIMPTGRLPEVPLIGALKPTKAPDLSFGETVTYSKRLPFTYPQHRRSVPRIVLTTDVDAAVKRNLYETNGNRVRLFDAKPWKTPWWWWWSEMKSGEVHGIIENDGWQNDLHEVTHVHDNLRHQQMCGGEETWGKLRREATEALAKLPP